MYVFNYLFLTWPSDLMFVTFRNFLLDYLNFCNKREICALRKNTEKKNRLCNLQIFFNTNNEKQEQSSGYIVTIREEKFFKESILITAKKNKKKTSNNNNNKNNSRKS